MNFSKVYWAEEPVFPGKGILGKSPSQLETRRSQLEIYLRYHMLKVNGHECIPIIDTLCAFLEIPNNVYEEPEIDVSFSNSKSSGGGIAAKLMVLSAFGGGSKGGKTHIGS
jgi:predicted outer membrane repeat protein